MMGKTPKSALDAQAKYNNKMSENGYYQTRPWLPEELRDWHALFVRRTREWKEFGVPMVMPDLPAVMLRPREKQEEGL